MAEDAVQDALLSAWNKRHEFTHAARLETWIHRIAVNAALQLLRKNRPGAFESLDFDIADHDGPETARLEDELGDSFCAAASKLSQMEHTCFVLKHLEQWRLREIANELDGKVDTVKQARYRGVQKLRLSMSDLRSDTNA